MPPPATSFAIYDPRSADDQHRRPRASRPASRWRGPRHGPRRGAGHCPRGGRRPGTRSRRPWRPLLLSTGAPPRPPRPAPAATSACSMRAKALSAGLDGPLTTPSAWRATSRPRPPTPVSRADATLVLLGVVGVGRRLAPHAPLGGRGSPAHRGLRPGPRSSGVVLCEYRRHRTRGAQRRPRPRGAGTRSGSHGRRPGARERGARATRDGPGAAGRHREASVLL